MTRGFRIPKFGPFSKLIVVFTFFSKIKNKKDNKLEQGGKDSKLELIGKMMLASED